MSFAAAAAASQIQIHLSSFQPGSPCRDACERLFAGASWLVSSDLCNGLLKEKGMGAVILCRMLTVTDADKGGLHGSYNNWMP